VEDEQGVDVEGATLDGRRVVAVSPDARWLAALGRDLCLQKVASLTESRCVSLPGNGAEDAPQIGDRSISWSPDSQRVALTEDVRLALEPDIWVVDVPAGEPRNLTDDGVRGRVAAGASFAPGTPLLDESPSWSPDGETIAFSRYSERSGSIYTVSVSGEGESSHQVTLAEDAAVVLQDPAVWTADGTALVYAPVPFDRDHPAGGLYVATLDGSEPRQVLGPDAELGPAKVLGLTPDGSRALVFYELAAATRGFGDFVYLVDIATGDREAIEPPPLDVDERSVAIKAAVLSPDGSKLAFTYTAGPRRSGLAVRDLAGGPVTVLAERDPERTPFSLGYAEMVWTEDGTMVVPTTGNGVAIYRLVPTGGT